jgi:hypothetical protein
MGSKAAMHATMAFARVSGAVVIAEGVENEFVADLMKAAGIRHARGFGLGKPTRAGDIEDVGKALLGRAALSGLRPRVAFAGDTDVEPVKVSARDHFEVRLPARLRLHIAGI